jgi:hypothetical protein
MIKEAKKAMNKNFKRAISSALAAAMAMSCVSFVSLTSAFAAEAQSWTKSSSCFAASALSALAETNAALASRSDRVHSFDSGIYKMAKGDPYQIDLDGLIANDEGAKTAGGTNASALNIYSTEYEGEEGTSAATAILYIDKRGAFQVPVEGATRITFSANSNSSSADATLWRFDPDTNPCYDATEGFEKMTISTGGYAEYTYDYLGSDSGYVSFLVDSASSSQVWLESVETEPAITSTAKLSCSEVSDYSDVTASVYDSETTALSADNVQLASDGTLTVAGTFPGDTYSVEITVDGTVYAGTFTAAEDAGTVTLAAAARTDYRYQFCTSYGGDSVLTDGTSVGTYYLADGAATTDADAADITLTNAFWHDAQHGLALNNGATIDIKNIVAPVKITVGGCQYSGATFTMTSGVEGEKDVTFTNNAGCSKGIDDSSNATVKYYNGASSELTITVSGSAYVPYIIVESIKESEIPTVTDVEGTVTGLNSEDASLAYLVFTNVDNEKDVVYTSVTNNAFTVTLSNDATYSVVEYGGNSSYTVTTDSFNIESKEVAVTANEAETPEAKSYKYNFTGSKVMPQTSTFKYGAFTTSDGILTMTNVTWHDKTHGITDSTGSTYTFKVAGDCQIVFTSCRYTNKNVVYDATASNGTVTPESTSALVDSSNDGQSLTFDYTGDAGTVTITVGGSNSGYVHQASVIYNIPYSADVYLGYTDGSTPNYKTVAEAIDIVNSMPGTDAVTLHVAPGTYNIGDTPLAITRENVKVVGSSADECVILGDFATGDAGISDTSGSGTIHNGTIVIRANNVSFENMTIENGTYKQYNSSALEIYAQNASFTNCAIKASCDTIYTGGGIATSGTFDNTLVTGYQDVVYGGGEFTFNDCTFQPNYANVGTSKSYSEARLFAPTGTTANNYKFEINNLTITTVDGDTGKAAIHFARPWSGSSTEGSAGTLVINGYQCGDDVAATRLQLSIDGKNLYGFDLKNASSGSTSEDCMFFVKEDANATDYNTPNKAINSANADTAVADESKLVDNDYKLVGEVNADLVTNEDINSVGFAIYRADGTFVANVENDTVYTIGDDTSKYYTVNYLEGSIPSSFTVKGYANYASYDVVNNEAQAVAVQ